MTLFPRVVELLRAQGSGDVLLLAGGIIPDQDAAALEALGFQAVFGPGTPTEEIVRFIRTHAGARTNGR
jgi:methylmalonyl-CoA mutase C-terminal domain/subunit